MTNRDTVQNHEQDQSAEESHEEFLNKYQSYESMKDLELEDIVKQIRKIVKKEYRCDV